MAIINNQTFFSRVHCVNVLRLLFSQAFLAERLLFFAETVFRITLDGCSAEIWPVRNAYVQLFAVLTKRVFGTPPIQQRSLHIQSRCKMSSHEFFTRYPSLYKQLADYLSEFRRLAQSNQLGFRHFFSAFPVLILLTHLYPIVHAEAEGKGRRLSLFLPDLLYLLFTLPARSLRELASAALCSTATFGELEEIFCCIRDFYLARDRFKLSSVQQNKSPLLLDSVHIFLRHISELKLTKLIKKDANNELDRLIGLTHWQHSGKHENNLFDMICETIWNNDDLDNITI